MLGLQLAVFLARPAAIPALLVFPFAGVTDARLGFDVADGVRLMLEARNLTDEDKESYGIDFGMYRTANWQQPRTYMFSAAYKW